MLRVTTAVAMLAVFVAQPPAAQAQRAPTTHPVTGVAIDPTGAVLANAEVVLTTTAGTTVQQTTTDAAGNFRFDGVPPGRYELRVVFEGFQASTSRVTVGFRGGDRRASEHLLTVGYERCQCGWSESWSFGSSALSGNPRVAVRDAVR